MHLRKSTLQNLFLVILTITVSLNASINILLTQVSSIFFIFFILICLKNIQVLEKIKKNYIDNKFFFIFFFTYISYLIVQIIPLPLSLIEIIAPNNYNLYNSIQIDKRLWSLSVDPSNSYFGILNCINALIIFLTFPVLFNRSKYLMKFLFFYVYWVLYMQFLQLIGC